MVQILTDGSSSRPTTTAASHDGEREVEVTVFALVPEFRQVKVRGSDGTHFSLTRHTLGIELSTLQEGQRLLCTVTRRLPRVLRAQILA